MFKKLGFVTIPNFFNMDECSEMRTRMIEDILPGWESDRDSMSVFTTDEGKRNSDDYFLSSGDKIRYFWEENAFGADGKLVNNSASLSINKVGHGLHDFDPVFQKYSYDHRLGLISRQLGMESPLVAQSMYIFKQPNIGGEVVPHQDGTFLYTSPQSVIGFWWALQDCTTENGCLWAIPGSNSYPIYDRFKRRGDGSGTVMEVVSDQPRDWEMSAAVPIECPAGTLVLLHHSLVHHSEENTSSKSRHAYSIHVIDGKHTYPEDNWLQRASFNPLV